MVCPRCVLAVKEALDESGIPWKHVDLGIVRLNSEPEEARLRELDQKLKKLGFERAEKKGYHPVIRTKKLLNSYLDAVEEGRKLPPRSEFLSQNLHRNYSYLSHRFSELEGMSIEQYWIALKTERAKELLETGELSITEIAFRLGYSSSQYFANQFREQTGQTPSAWKKSNKRRSGRHALGE